MLNLNLTLFVQIVNFIVFLAIMNVIFFRPVGTAIARRLRERSLNHRIDDALG